MKHFFCCTSFLIVFVFSAFAQNTNPKKEVLLVGIIKNSKLTKEPYRPLLKMAKAYQPQAIFVQAVPSFDTTSLRNAYGNFLDKSDSILSNSVFDMSHIAFLQNKKLKDLKPYQHEKLSKYYYSNRSNANRLMHEYFAKNKMNKSKLVANNENTNLIFPLALSMDINYLYSIDDQSEKEAYQKSWKECTAQSKLDKQDKKGKKILSKLNRGETFSSLFNRQTYFVNKKNTIKGYHTLYSFRYRTEPFAACTEGTQIWDRKNQKIADNIGQQVNQNNFVRNIVFLEPAHIIGVKAFLEAAFPELKVRTLR